MQQYANLVKVFIQLKYDSFFMGFKSDAIKKIYTFNKKLSYKVNAIRKICIFK